MRKDPIENARQLMLKFMRREIIGAQEDEPLTSFELRHVETKRSLGEWKAQEGIDPPIEDIAEEAVSICQDDADGLGGSQQYHLVSFYANGARFANSSSVFRIRGEEDPDSDVENTKRRLGKDEIALVALKTITDTNKMLMAERGAANNYLLAALHTATEANQRYQETHMNNLIEHEKLVDQSEERLEARAEKEHARQIKEDLYEHAKLLLPYIGATIMGKKTPQLPANTAPDGEQITPLHALIGQFLNTLSPEQTQALGQFLSPPQQVALQGIFDAYARDMQAKAEAAEAQEKKKGARRNGKRAKGPDHSPG